MLLLKKGLKSVETTPVENEFGQPLRTDVDEDERSFITIQKGHRPDAKEMSWWLDDDYSVGDPIKEKEVKSIIKDQVEGKDDFIGQVDKLIKDYISESEQRRMPMKDFL